MSKSNPIVHIVTKCPMCGLKYEKKDIKVISSKDGTVTLYLNCRRCKSSIVMVVVLGGLGITSVSMVTDIREDDFEKVNRECVKYDDVLEMHKFFQSQFKKEN